MEDHQNTSRLAVFGAFSRCVPNYQTQPPVEHFTGDIAVYHAQPHGNRTPLGEIVRPTLAVDTTDLMDAKEKLLASHASQAAWLGACQAMSYLQTMKDLGREVGLMTEKFTSAEGWRQHIHLGLSGAHFDPLSDALTDHITYLRQS
jgi:LmbE family N-acetylglucosaminyl deacetylase